MNHYGITRKWVQKDKPIKYEGMKPRTKREREALMMSASLPEPSASFQRWAWRGLWHVGSDLHHCIFERRYYRKQESVCIAVCGDDGEYLEAAEVSVRKWKILQCRGDHNRDSSRHAEIVKLVTDNLKTLKQRRIDYEKQEQERKVCRCR